MWIIHQCKITSDNITDWSNFMKDNNYRCPKDLKNHVIYNVYLHESEVGITALVSCLDQWLSNTEAITVNGIELDINKTCSRLDDNLSPECSDIHPVITTPAAVSCYKDRVYYGVGFLICGLAVGTGCGALISALVTGVAMYR